MSHYDEKVDSKDNVSTDKQRILMICTSVTKSSWGSSTGLWFEELSTPYYIFKEAGYQIDISSTNGSIAVDPACWGIDYNPPDSQQKFIDDPEAQQKFNNAQAINLYLNGESKYSINEYGCLFLCGGHGCIDDFFNNGSLQRCIEIVHNETKGCVAAVCHGSVGLLGSKLSNGQPLIANKFIAVFSDEEERILGLDVILPFSLESMVEKEGAVCVPGPPWNPKAVVDGRLATGQNPHSSLETAQRALDILRSLGPSFSPPQNENKPWGS